MKSMNTEKIFRFSVGIPSPTLVRRLLRLPARCNAPLGAKKISSKTPRILLASTLPRKIIILLVSCLISGFLAAHKPTWHEIIIFPWKQANEKTWESRDEWHCTRHMAYDCFYVVFCCRVYWTVFAFENVKKLSNNKALLLVFRLFGVCVHVRFERAWTLSRSYTDSVGGMTSKNFKEGLFINKVSPWLAFMLWPETLKLSLVSQWEKSKYHEQAENLLKEKQTKKIS